MKQKRALDLNLNFSLSHHVCQVQVKEKHRHTSKKDWLTQYARSHLRKRGLRRWINCLVNIVASRMPSIWSEVNKWQNKYRITISQIRSERESLCHVASSSADGTTTTDIVAVACCCRIQIDWSNGWGFFYDFTISSMLQKILSVAWIYLQSILMPC